jgi:hypothetical protein
MQITEFVQTVKWIESQYNKRTIELILKGSVADYVLGHRPAPSEDNTSELKGLTSVTLKALNDMAIVRTRLEAHPFAPEILRTFGLEKLLDEEFPIIIGELIVSASASDRERERIMVTARELTDVLYPMSSNWRLLTKTLDPLQQLLIPKEVLEEHDFDNILTIELRYAHDINPQPRIISEVLESVEQLYAAISISLGKKEFKHLSVIFISSGSSFRFDFKGLGEPIKQIKELLVEAWNKIRHRKADDLHQNNQTLLGSLEVLRQISHDAQKNILDPEEAMRLREQVIRNTMALFEAGALPREVPNVEIVSNQKLLQGIQVKLLPAASIEEETGTASQKKGRKSSSKKKQNNTKRTRKSP